MCNEKLFKDILTLVNIVPMCFFDGRKDCGYPGRILEQPKTTGSGSSIKKIHLCKYTGFLPRGDSTRELVKSGYIWWNTFHHQVLKLS